jgi:fatty acid desaturase
VALIIIGVPSFAATEGPWPILHRPVDSRQYRSASGSQFLALAVCQVGKLAVLILLTTFFALGLHPLGGRWIQEHYYIMGKPQETYSYYGPLNWVMFNMGFHNEHHDFPMVAWSRLPQVSRLAPELYQTLFAHQSYSRLLLYFIFDKKINCI